jgi:hypothetical protein
MSEAALLERSAPKRSEEPEWVVLDSPKRQSAGLRGSGRDRHIVVSPHDVTMVRRDPAPAPPADDLDF